MHKRLTSISLALVYFVVSTPLANAAQTNLWQERKSKRNLQVAALSSSLHNLHHIHHDPLKAIHQKKSVHKKITTKIRKENKPASSLLESIPLAHAKINEVYSPDQQTENKAPFVVLIQDVHLNFEAQLNIARLLGALNEKSLRSNPDKPLMVGVEGAFGSFNLSALRNFPDQNIVKAVAGNFLKENQIAAPSYLGAISEISPLIVGIETPEPYDANVKAYLDSLEIKASVKASIEELKKKHLVSKQGQLNEKLKLFDKKWNQFHSGVYGIGQYLNDLDRLIKRLRLENVKNISSQKFLKAYQLEHSMDFSKVEKERTAALNHLVKNLNQQQLSALVNVGLKFKSGTISLSAYYSHLEKIFQKHSIPLSKTPEFKNYIDYVLLTDSIDAEELFAEILMLEDSIEKVLVKSENEKRIISESQYLVLVSKLVEFSLTPKDWEEYSRLSDVIENNLLRLDSFEEFYHQADIRSVHLVEKLLEIHNSNLVNPSVGMIVGGFHTPLIKEQLKTKGVGYAIVTPQITEIKEAGKTSYLSIFAQEKTPLDKLFSGEKLFLAPDRLAAGSTRGNAAFSKMVALSGLHTGFVHPSINTIPSVGKIIRTQLEDGLVVEFALDSGPSFRATNARNVPALVGQKISDGEISIDGYQSLSLLSSTEDKNEQATLTLGFVYKLVGTILLIGTLGGLKKEQRDRVAEFLASILELPFTLLDLTIFMLRPIIIRLNPNFNFEWFVDMHDSSTDTIYVKRLFGLRYIRMAGLFGLYSGLLFGFAYTASVFLSVSGQLNFGYLGMLIFSPIVLGQSAIHLRHNIRNPDAPLTLTPAQENIQRQIRHHHLRARLIRRLGDYESRNEPVSEDFKRMLIAHSKIDPSMKLFTKYWLPLYIRALSSSNHSLIIRAAQSIETLVQLLPQIADDNFDYGFVNSLFVTALKSERYEVNRIALISIRRIYNVMRSNQAREEFVEAYREILRSRAQPENETSGQSRIGLFLKKIFFPIYSRWLSNTAKLTPSDWRSRSNNSHVSLENLARLTLELDPSGKLFDQRARRLFADAIQSGRGGVSGMALDILEDLLPHLLSTNETQAMLYGLILKASQQNQPDVLRRSFNLINKSLPVVINQPASVHHRWLDLLEKVDKKIIEQEDDGEAVPTRIRSEEQEENVGNPVFHGTSKLLVELESLSIDEASFSWGQLWQLLQNHQDLENYNNLAMDIAVGRLMEAYDEAEQVFNEEGESFSQLKQKQNQIRSEAWEFAIGILASLKRRPFTYDAELGENYRILKQLLGLKGGELDRDIIIRGYQKYFPVEIVDGDPLRGSTRELPKGHSSQKDLVAYVLMDLGFRIYNLPTIFTDGMRESRDSPSYGQMKFYFPYLDYSHSELALMLRGYERMAENVPEGQIDQFWAAVRTIARVFVHDGDAFYALGLGDDLNELVESHKQTPERMEQEIRKMLESLKEKLKEDDSRHAIIDAILQYEVINPQRINREVDNLDPTANVHRGVDMAFWMLHHNGDEAKQFRESHPQALDQVKELLIQLRSKTVFGEDDVVRIESIINYLRNLLTSAPDNLKENIEKAIAYFLDSKDNISSEISSSRKSFDELLPKLLQLEIKILQHSVHSELFTGSLLQAQDRDQLSDEEFEVLVEHIYRFVNKELRLYFIEDGPVYRENLKEDVEELTKEVLEELKSIRERIQDAKAYRAIIKRIRTRLNEIDRLDRNVNQFLQQRVSRLSNRINQSIGELFDFPIPEDADFKLSKKETQAILYLGRNPEYRLPINPIHRTFRAYFQAIINGQTREQATTAFQQELRKILAESEPTLLGETGENGEIKPYWFLNDTGVAIHAPETIKLGSLDVKVLRNPIDILHLGWGVPGSCLDCVDGTHQEFAAAYVVHPLIATISIEESDKEKESPVKGRLNVAFDPKRNTLYVLNILNESVDSKYVALFGETLVTWAEHLVEVSGTKGSSTRIVVVAPKTMIAEGKLLGPKFQSLESGEMTLLKGLLPMHADLLNEQIATYQNLAWEAESRPAWVYRAVPSKRRSSDDDVIESIRVRGTAVFDTKKLFQSVTSKKRSAYKAAMNEIAPRYQGGVRRWVDPHVQSLSRWIVAYINVRAMSKEKLNSFEVITLQREEEQIVNNLDSMFRELGILDQGPDDIYLINDTWTPDADALRGRVNLVRVQSKEEALKVSISVYGKATNTTFPTLIANSTIERFPSVSPEWIGLVASIWEIPRILNPIGWINFIKDHPHDNFLNRTFRFLGLFFILATTTAVSLFVFQLGIIDNQWINSLISAFVGLIALIATHFSWSEVLVPLIWGQNLTSEQKNFLKGMPVKKSREEAAQFLRDVTITPNLGVRDQRSPRINAINQLQREARQGINAERSLAISTLLLDQAVSDPITSREAKDESDLAPSSLQIHVLDRNSFNITSIRKEVNKLIPSHNLVLYVDDRVPLAEIVRADRIFNQPNVHFKTFNINEGIDFSPNTIESVVTNELSLVQVFMPKNMRFNPQTLRSLQLLKNSKWTVGLYLVLSREQGILSLLPIELPQIRKMLKFENRFFEIFA